jgi:hypothetical protein
MSIPSVPHMATIGESIEKTRADQARGLADIQRQLRGNHTIGMPVEYRDDKDGMARDPHGPKRRVGKAVCPQCGGKTEVHQSLNVSDGSWTPSAEHVLANVCGWRLVNGLTFCGGACAVAYGVQMKQHVAVQPVMRVADQGIAKTLYADTVTVPAKPPPQKR